MITLPDETITHISHELIGRAITIPKSFLDDLVSCHVVFPNGMTYEAFPTNNVAQAGDPKIFFADATSPFRSCSIGFRGVAESASGTYELLSQVKHSDGTEALTRKRFIMTFIASTVPMP